MVEPGQIWASRDWLTMACIVKDVRDGTVTVCHAYSGTYSTMPVDTLQDHWMLTKQRQKV